MLLQFLFMIFLPYVLGFSKRVSLGGLFDQDETIEGEMVQGEMIQRAFELSVKSVNRNRHANKDELANIFLVSESHLVNSSDILQTSEKVCDLLGMGIAGVFGPQDKLASEHVQSICDSMEVPHIAARWDPEQVRGKVINLYPHADALATVFYRLVKEYNWKAFTILYENSDSLIRMNKLLKLWNPKGHTVTIHHLGDGPDFRNVLRNVKRSADYNIVIDCSYDILSEVLRQAQQIGIMSDRHSYIVSSLDLQTLDLEPYQYSEMNFTGVRMIDPEDSVVEEIFNTEYLDWGFDDPSKLRLEPALMFDAVQLFARALKQLNDAINGDVKQLSCNGSQSWEHGLSLSNFMRLSEMKGLTGLIKFDTAGFRSNFHLDIVQLNVNGLEKIGVWNSTNGIEWISKSPSRESFAEQSLRNKTFIVLISLTKPYGMLKESAATMAGNDRFEGFGIDIITRIADMLGFNYTFELQADNVYGSLNPVTKTWNGMIRKLMNDEADLAITDLTITSERETAVDFTMPFMNLGITILYKKATKTPPSLFSFLSPFSNEVWLYLIGSYIFVSLLLFVIGRICPAEWNNPYPCIEEPEELENQLSLKNSLWFTIGSIMMQGSEIAPIGISTRMLAGIYWFFCLIIVSSYTANLAAFLTVENINAPIKNAEDLANQDTIKYGAKRDGSTIAFFRDSNHTTYQKMYEYMMNNEKEVLTSTNEEGLAKVIAEDYAFLMESSSVDYITERECDVTQINGQLDAKGYGIAMKKHAPYRNALSTAVLKLQESGVLTKLKDKWWKEKRGGGRCQEKPGMAAEVSELGLDNVGGVFLVLVTGVALSCFYTVWELLWDVGCTSCKEDVPFKEELVEELKFVIKCSGTTKPVRRRKGSTDRSEKDSTRDCTPPYGFLPTVITTSVNDDK
uniref:Ionotropic receptor 2 n=1 Tax=Sirex noctilio TaxID=36765 RepID=A0A857N3G1_9HYME|nr:ionotropic receptor 2 [Sirex noctilio]